ncbi:unnamed protein product [Ambrosiozyma monospora]|uniref:Unnamed protein product n=1 Tax=Ambrosiozyma monospora TaxID=43982 RepID=A0A9W6Z561_AMBMO|nr:unnamed protein product [Ambrosiozyma monospora]
MIKSNQTVLDEDFEEFHESNAEAAEGAEGEVSIIETSAKEHSSVTSVVESPKKRMGRPSRSSVRPPVAKKKKIRRYVLHPTYTANGKRRGRPPKEAEYIVLDDEKELEEIKSDTHNSTPKKNIGRLRKNPMASGPENETGSEIGNVESQLHEEDITTANENSISNSTPEFSELTIIQTDPSVPQPKKKRGRPPKPDPQKLKGSPRKRGRPRKDPNDVTTPITPKKKKAKTGADVSSRRASKSISTSNSPSFLESMVVDSADGKDVSQVNDDVDVVTATATAALAVAVAAGSEVGIAAIASDIQDRDVEAHEPDVKNEAETSLNNLADPDMKSESDDDLSNCGNDNVKTEAGDDLSNWGDNDIEDEENEDDENDAQAPTDTRDDVESETENHDDDVQSGDEIENDVHEKEEGETQVEPVQSHGNSKVDANIIKNGNEAEIPSFGDSKEAKVEKTMESDTSETQHSVNSIDKSEKKSSETVRGGDEPATVEKSADNDTTSIAPSSVETADKSTVESMKSEMKS